MSLDVRSSFARSVALLFVPALVIALAVFGAASIERNAALHAATAEQQSGQLLTAMLDQETGARGFFQTRRLSFLQPWYKGTTDFTAALAAARRTDAGDSWLQHQLETQAGLAAEWHAGAGAAIRATLRSGHRPPLAGALERKAMMDAFRAANARFSNTLVTRRDEALGNAGLLAVAIAAATALLIAGIALLLLRRISLRESRRRRGEGELRELLQVSDSEEESRTLLIRHIERTVPGAGAAVLNRNNSDDRLEPSVRPDAHLTPLRDLPQTPLQPRSCLAVRLSRPHERRHSEDTLAQCEVCGKLAAEIACEPLLVGGQVIGSVLVASEERIGPAQRSHLRDAVVQAAPIIANQRNLSLAETRAASDSLTGLPNRRAADDTLKRMAAQAGRAMSPLTMVLIDLDHFKQINDVHGHEMGDEALAAVGSILSSTLRASDFAARYGGEEFLVLLPDTNREQGCFVAEKLRAAIAEAELRSGGLTASFGVATVPDDASDPEQLLRKADRALYLAKNSGRNRVEAAVTLTVPSTAGDDA